MKKLTLEEIVKIISDARELAEENDEEFELSELFTEGADYFEGEVAEALKDFEEVDYGSVHGDGSDAYAVMEYKPTGQYVGLTGWYSSYEGYSFEDEIKFMKSYQVTHWREEK